MRRTAVVAFMATLAGCGRSGSNPVLFPEIRFQVVPTGQTTFRVDSLVAGGVEHPSVIGQEFTATSFFNFVFENATSPRSGAFCRTSDTGAIKVVLTVTGQKSQTVTEGPPSVGCAHPVVISSDLPGTPIVTTPTASSPEVRFDVCVPSPDASSCFTANDSGIFGLTFSGTFGDLFMTYLVVGTTPGIYFLQNARDNVNAVLALQPTTGQLLRIELYINGAFIEAQSDSHNVIISKDL